MTTVPPILITHCPAGHDWPRIDPRWFNGKGSGHRPVAEVWCPDHHAERKATIQAKINQTKLKAAHAYDAMPLPTTKACTNKNPTAHRAGAVLPITDFYLRPGKTRTDGSQATYVDPQCKDCRRAQAEARRAKQSVEDRRRYQRNYRKRKRQQAKRARQRVLNPTMVDGGAFFTWMEGVQPQLTATEARMIARARTDSGRIEHHIVDAVMTRYGATDQLAIYYG